MDASELQSCLGGLVEAAEKEKKKAWGSFGEARAQGLNPDQKELEISDLAKLLDAVISSADRLNGSLQIIRENFDTSLFGSGGKEMLFSVYKQSPLCAVVEIKSPCGTASFKITHKQLEGIAIQLAEYCLAPSRGTADE